MHPPYRGISVITPLPFGGGEGGGANWLLVCEVTPTGLLTRVVGKFFSHGGYHFLTRRISCSHTEDVFFSHRTHRFNRTFLRTVSISQNASGIQISQNVSAIIITNKGHNEAYILFIGVSR